jgi:hypothetical protein
MCVYVARIVYIGSLCKCKVRGCDSVAEPDKIFAARKRQRQSKKCFCRDVLFEDARARGIVLICVFTLMKLT